MSCEGLRSTCIYLSVVMGYLMFTSKIVSDGFCANTHTHYLVLCLYLSSPLIIKQTGLHSVRCITYYLCALQGIVFNIYLEQYDKSYFSNETQPAVRRYWLSTVQDICVVCLFVFCNGQACSICCCKNKMSHNSTLFREKSTYSWSCRNASIHTFDGVWFANHGWVKSNRSAHPTQSLSWSCCSLSLDVINYLEGSDSPMGNLSREEPFYLFWPSDSMDVDMAYRWRPDPSTTVFLILPRHQPLSDSITSFSHPFVA